MVTYYRLKSGEWGVKGPCLQPGTDVDVVKRSGAVTVVTVGSVVWAGADGTTIATISSFVGRKRRRTAAESCAYDGATAFDLD